ncbi:MAG: iron ABC transporter permease [Spirochaetaceae bacterium]|nr:iron ABC transporter permease [Spirochaetaceae bacterium]
MKFAHKVLLLVLLLFAAVLLSLALGAERIDFASLFNSSETKTFSHILVFEIRAPRTLIALFAGALLAGSGCLFQGFFRNALADPAIMGVSSGAALGAVVVSVLLSMSAIQGSTPVLIQCGAFAGALFAVWAAYIIAGNRRYEPGAVSLLLTGTALSACFSAIYSLLLIMRYNELHKMYAWSLGSFNGKTWNDALRLIIPAIIVLPFYFTLAKPLDLLSLGERSASSLGLNTKWARLSIIALGSLGTALAVCSGGTIGFIGLIGPHIARLLVGPSHKKLIVSSMLLGALLLLVSDIVARTAAAPMEIPVGIITSLMGTPFFLSVMAKGRGGRY